MVGKAIAPGISRGSETIRRNQNVVIIFSCDILHDLGILIGRVLLGGIF